MNLHCGESYPDAPPEVTFVSKVNLPCVNQSNGKVCNTLQKARGYPADTKDPLQVDLSKIPSLTVWKRDFTMETILTEIRRYMAAPAHKKLPQPPEGTNF